VLRPSCLLTSWPTFADAASWPAPATWDPVEVFVRARGLHPHCMSGVRISLEPERSPHACGVGLSGSHQNREAFSQLRDAGCGEVSTGIVEVQIGQEPLPRG
jgi:hypothetical protein